MSRGTVFIVEDERLVAEDLRDSLTAVGYDVVGMAGDGETAVDRVGELQPDVVLMDIHLDGDMDGIATARAIRSRYGTPVVYLTAFANDQTLERARETDAFGFIVKPFQEKAVIAAIEMALGKRAAERARLERETLVQSGLMNLPLGVFMTDPHDRIVFANATARHHIGRDLDADGGVRLEEVFQVNETAEADSDDAAGFVVEMTGRRLPVYFSEEPLRDAKGQKLGRIVIYQDAEHPPFSGELGRLLRAYMRSTQASPNSPEQFLTICAWSKRIKVDDDKWVSFEDFLSHYLGLHVTHGISPEVAGEWVSRKSPATKKVAGS
ncbi:MAG: response regulator [Verrucomicrobia bacterium]|nr:MAG: response regulator [Verrucomicrobiota bacterium]